MSGNLETITLFIYKYAESKGVHLSLDYLLEHSEELRDAIVDATLNYDPFKGFREADSLNKIFFDCVESSKEQEMSISDNALSGPKSLKDYKNMINDIKNHSNHSNHSNHKDIGSENKENLKNNTDKSFELKKTDSKRAVVFKSG